jgi:hypothetical protein
MKKLVTLSGRKGSKKSTTGENTKASVGRVPPPACFRHKDLLLVALQEGDADGIKSDGA